MVSCQTVAGCHGNADLLAPDLSSFSVIRELNGKPPILYLLLERVCGQMSALNVD